MFGLEDELQNKITKLKEKLNQRQWTDCEKELPIDNELYLVWDNYHMRNMVAAYNPRHNCWDDEWGDDYYTSSVGGKITHWMKLPDKPSITNIVT